VVETGCFNKNQDAGLGTCRRWSGVGSGAFTRIKDAEQQNGKGKEKQASF
jgi:hypothetical protein